MALHVIILAAGKGKRMRSDLPKVLHRLQGIPLLRHVLFTALGLEPAGVTVVVGHRADLVRLAVDEEEAQCVDQGDPRGTGHAVSVAMQAVPAGHDPVLVLYGDVPLVRLAALRDLLTRFDQERPAAMLISGVLADPSGYGRILRTETGDLDRIVEQADCTPEQAAIREVNIGVGVYRREALEWALARLQPNNAQGEFYLTDVASLLRGRGERVGVLVTDDPDQFQGVNTPDDLERCEYLAQTRPLTSGS